MPLSYTHYHTHTHPHARGGRLVRQKQCVADPGVHLRMTPVDPQSRRHTFMLMSRWDAQD